MTQPGKVYNPRCKWCMRRKRRLAMVSRLWQKKHPGKMRGYYLRYKALHKKAMAALRRAERKRA